MNSAEQSARPAEVFVGRRPELASLAAALHAVCTGEPRIVVIQGDAGIGKSSLISEFLASNRHAPAIIVSGDESESLLPSA